MKREKYIVSVTDPWCDVDGDEQGFSLASTSGQYVFLAALEVVNGELRTPVRWTLNIGERLLYVRTSEGVVVGQGHDSGNAYAVTSKGIQTHGSAHGQDCVAVRNDSIYVMRAPGDHYDIISLATRFVISVRCMPTSQGFRDIQPDGTPVFGDEQFMLDVHGRKLARPMRRGAFWIGQSMTDPAAEVLAADQRRGFWLFRNAGVIGEPHIAASGVSYAFCARTARGAAVALVDPPYPDDEIFVSVPAPAPPPSTPDPKPQTPTPTPRPTPPQEPPMLSGPEMRRNIEALIDFYNGPDGLNRAARGLPSPIVINDPAIWDWVSMAAQEGVDKAERQIKTFPEFKEQHQNDPHPQ